MINLSSAILDPIMRADPVGPRITYYDDASAERIELSAATLANWAAKTGNLLRDELGAGAGSRVAVLLPAHWQTAAVLFGAWWIGAEVLIGADAADADDADIAMCTADRIDEADAAVAATGGEVVVLSLDPFGRRAATSRWVSPTMRPRCGCTATRSSPNALRAQPWPDRRPMTCWRPARNVRLPWA